MKLKIWYFERNESLNVAKGISEIRKGSRFKFTYLISADLEVDSITLELAICGATYDHDFILGSLTHELKKLGKKRREVFVGYNGGHIKIEENKLIFFGSSSKYGAYNKELLKRCEHDIKEQFGVNEVEYETDCVEKV